MYTYDPITNGAIQMVPIWDCKHSSSAVRGMPGSPDAFTSLFLLLYHRHFLLSWLGNVVSHVVISSHGKHGPKIIPRQPDNTLMLEKTLEFAINHSALTILLVIFTSTIYYEFRSPSNCLQWATPSCHRTWSHSCKSTQHVLTPGWMEYSN